MISIVVPVLNEEKVIARTISQIKDAMKSVNYELIIVNDGSVDKTRSIIEKISKIRVVNHPHNLGYGASIKAGMKIAKGEWIMITDADGTYPIMDMPKLIKYSRNYDMVVGSRTGKRVQIPLLRRPAKWFINKLANFMSGHKIPDLNSGFRIFKKGMAQEFLHLYPQRFSFTTTISLAFLTSGYLVKYIPINYYARKGKSTIHPIKDFLGFINLIIRIITYFNPFKFFFFISTVLFLIGLCVFLYTSIVLGRIADISVIVILISAVQVFLFGLIADLIVKSRR